jgi:hypothetical protein
MSGGDLSDIRRGTRALVVILVLGAVIAIAGSALFWSGRFDHLPYRWF